MDETYASNVANLNERLREYKQGEVDKASSLINSANEKYNTQLAEYQDKWKAVQEGGQDEVAAQMGIKGVYQGAKKVYQIYKKYKGKKAGADTDDEDEEEDEDDGTKGGSEGDPQGEQLDKGNDPAPLTDEDRAALRDPMKETRDFRQATQDRMNSRLKELGFGDDDTSAPSASGSASNNPVDTGGGTDDANVTQARATAEGTDLGEPYEESAFGDLSGIPEEGTAESVMYKINAQAATERGGNIGQGGSARGTTGASDAATSQNPPTSEGQPASGSATEGGNGAASSQSQSSYNPEGSQSRTLDQNAGTDDVTGQPKQPSTKPASGEGGDGDANPLDADLPADLPAAPAAEGGGFLADLGLSETAAAAIPVAGEALAFVGGLVAIGEGIYHLFHPPHKKPPVAPIAGTQIPQSVQAKYANALPSFDSSSDNTASDAVF
jgi:hypothetical protein